MRIKVIGYVVETGLGLITKIDGEFYHSCTKFQSAYLFNTRKNATKVAKSFRRKFVYRHELYFANVHKVFVECEQK